MFLGRNHHEATAEKQMAFAGNYTSTLTSQFFKIMVMRIFEGDGLQVTEFCGAEGGTLRPAKMTIHQRTSGVVFLAAE